MTVLAQRAGEGIVPTDITLYEVVLSDGSSASPFVWRTKFSLMRKGLPYRSTMLALTDIPKHFEGRFQTCPILDFDDRQMSESLAIADWLDAARPDLPALFSGPAERAMIGFFDHWLLGIIVGGLLPLYTLDAYQRAAPLDQAYYRQSREPSFGQTLEEVVANREDRLPDVRRSLEPVRQTILHRPFIGGDEPNFADMCMLGVFIFVGTIATLPLLAADDPLVAYAERGLAAFGEATATLELKLRSSDR